LIAIISFTRTVYSKNLSDEDQLILVGAGAYNDGFYDIAEKQFTEFIKDFPSHGKVYDVCYLLAKTLLIQKREHEARKVFLRIINEAKHFEYLDYAMFWAAQIEMTVGKAEAAHKLFYSITQKSPNFEWLDQCYYRLGLLDLRSSRFTAAESFFKKVSLRSKNKELVRFSSFWLGIINYKQGNYATSETYFKALWADSPWILQDYSRYALFRLAESQLKLGRWDEAREAFKTFYGKYRADPLAADAYWRVGFCEYRLGNTKEATEIFQSFKENSRFSTRSYAEYLLGEILLAEGDSSSSSKEFNLILNQPRECCCGEPRDCGFLESCLSAREEEANKIFKNYRN